MLTLTLASQLVDLPEDAAVALSYQVADLNDLQSRGGGFSETFTLPYTARNARVAELAYLLDAATSFPYRKLPAEVRYNDALVLSGQALLQRSGESGYEVFLVSDTGELFTAVAERQLQELDLSALDHQLTSATVQAAQGPGPAYTYTFVNDGRFTERPRQDGYASAHYTELQPALFSRYLLEQIVAQALPGYTLRGTLLDDERFQRHLLLGGAVGPARRQAYLDAHTVVARTSTELVLNGTLGGIKAQSLLLDDVESDPGNHLQTDPTGQASLYRLLPEVSDYRVQFEGEFTFAEGSDFAASFVVAAENQLGTHTETIYDATAGKKPTGGRVKIDTVLERAGGSLGLSIDVAVLDRLRVRLAPGAKVTITPLARAYDRSPVHLDAGLPDWSQADFLLLLANQFGALFQADPVTRTVRADRLQDVAAHLKAGKVRDWTSRLDFTTRPRLTYRLGNVARRNVFRYADPPSGYEVLTDAGYDGRGALLCPNDNTLEAEAEAYAAPAAALREEVAFRRLLRLAYTPRFTQKDGSTFVPWRAGLEFDKEHYTLEGGRYWQAKRKTTARPVTNDDNWQLVAREADVFTGAGDTVYCGLYAPLGDAQGVRVGDTNTAPGWVPTAGVTFEGLDYDADLLPDYFPVLAAILRRVVLLEVELRLNTVDLATLDFTRPVRLNVLHWPGYGPLQGDFYLNLIDQYQPGSTGPVRCELVALNGPVITQATLSERERIFDYTFDQTFN